MLSAVSLKKFLSTMVDAAQTLMDAVAANGAILILLSADTAASGIVLQAVFSPNRQTRLMIGLGWAISVALGIAGHILWKFTFNRKNWYKMVFPLIVTIFVSGIDTLIDTSLLNLNWYGVKFVIQHGPFATHQGVMWWLLTGALFMITTFSEPLVVMIRYTRNTEFGVRLPKNAATAAAVA